MSLLPSVLGRWNNKLNPRWPRASPCLLRLSASTPALCAAAPDCFCADGGDSAPPAAHSSTPASPSPGSPFDPEPPAATAVPQHRVHTAPPAGSHTEMQPTTRYVIILTYSSVCIIKEKV